MLGTGPYGSVFLINTLDDCGNWVVWGKIFLAQGLKMMEF